MLTEEVKDVVYGLYGEMDPFYEHALELVQDNLTDDELMFGKYVTKQICAKPPRCEGADQDIGIEEDFQETSRKTSSSVR